LATEDKESRAAITRLQRGDIGGLAVLVKRYQVQAVRAAYLIIADRAVAEDVVQSAFLRFYERVHHFDPERPFAPYFMRIVANEALQVARKRARELSLDAEVSEGELTFADLLPNTSAEIEAVFEAGESEDELRHAVKEALKKLSPDQRAVIVLRYYLGMSEQELADELNTPNGTIKWRLFAARKQLRVLLRPFWESRMVEKEA
jgi:RNA polymerase sigma-70 factor, ECF subfamily